MEEDKKVKIVARLLIVMVAVLLCIIISMIWLILNKKEEKDENSQNTIQENVIEHNTTQGNANIVNSVNAANDFEIQFLKLENNKQNMIYSPLSIKYALKMLNEGANGDTKAQIEKVIGDLNLTQYDNIDDILSFANALYIRNEYVEHVKKDFLKLIEEKYNADIAYDDFNSASNVNKWIERKTLGKIKNILSDEVVQNSDSKMLLINALAIDMKWDNIFEDNDTHGEKFYLTDGTDIVGTTMNKKTSKNSEAYYKDNEVTLLSMDLKQYEDTQLQFVAIMPNEEKLSEYISKISMNDINNVIKNLKLASEVKDGLDISIPKFSFDYNLNLKENLINLGIADAFDDSLADFSNMSSSESKLYVSDALHKANIDFSEKGIKASAVTIMSVSDAMAMVEENKPEEVKIDKPFLYLIKDKNTDEIWFIGTVYQPNLWENDKADYQYR